MMSKERIHELREEAVHQGLFVEGVCDEGIRVSFFEPVYVDEVFIIKEEPLMCPECGSFLLEFEKKSEHPYDFTHICANQNCSFNNDESECECDDECCCCCSHCGCAEEESTLGLELSFMEKAKMLFDKVMNKIKEFWAAL